MLRRCLRPARVSAPPPPPPPPPRHQPGCALHTARPAVSAAEDPEKILDQAVTDMQTDLIRLRQAAAEVRCCGAAVACCCGTT